MRLFPRIRRRSASYTDQIIEALQRRAGGAAQTVEPERLAVVEAAAGLFGRLLSAAAVTPSTTRTAGVTPSFLYDAGFACAMLGEAVFRINLSADLVMSFERATSYNILGADRYELTIPRPNSTLTVTVPAAGVVHLKWRADLAQPWRGRSPVSTTTATLAARLETALSAESDGPVGHLIAVPSVAAAPDLSALKGGTALIEGVAGDWRTGLPQGQRPQRRGDFAAQRFGADPPDALRALRWDASQHVLASFGIAPELLVERSGGADRRAAHSEFVRGPLAALAGSFQAELRAKLDTDLAIDLEGLIPRERRGDARIVKDLVDSGVAVERALVIAGFESPAA